MTRAVLAAVLLAAGCGSNSSDKIELKVLVSSVDVDTSCVTELCLTSGLPIQVRYAPDEYVGPQEHVDILQYRIDYDLRDSDLELPYFASRANFGFGANDGADVDLSPAGYHQREAVREGPDPEVRGTGVLMLAGYDSADELVLVETEFELRFRDEGGKAAKDAAGTDEAAK